MTMQPSHKRAAKQCTDDISPGLILHHIVPGPRLHYTVVSAVPPGPVTSDQDPCKSSVTGGAAFQLWHFPSLSPNTLQPHGITLRTALPSNVPAQWTQNSRERTSWPGRPAPAPALPTYTLARTRASSQTEKPTNCVPVFHCPVTKKVWESFVS